MIDEPRKDPKDLVVKPKVDPLIANLPLHLKKPENYEKIMRAILDAGATKHSHGEMVDWAACSACQSKLRDRAEFIKKLGFTSPAQFMKWSKVNRFIKERVPLGSYKS